MDAINLFMMPTPVQATNTGQFAGYVAPNVLLDSNNQPLTDENGYYLTSD